MPKRNYSVGDIVRVKCPGQFRYGSVDQSTLVGKLGTVYAVWSHWVSVSFDEPQPVYVQTNKGPKLSYKTSMLAINPDHLRLVFPK